MLGAATGGAIGGLLGGLLGSPFKSPQRRRLMTVVGSVLGITIGRHFVQPQVNAWQLTRQIQERIPVALSENNGRLYAAEMTRLLSDPTFVAWAERQPSAQAAQRAAAELSAKGMSRLSYSQRERLRDLKLELASKSGVCCQGFWTGELSDNTLYGAMQQHFSENEFRDWIRLSMLATRLEIGKRSPPVRFPEDALSTSFMSLRAILTPEEWRPFASTLQLGAKAPPDHGCAALLLMMSLLPRLDRRDQDVLTAFFLSPLSFE